MSNRLKYILLAFLAVLVVSGTLLAWFGSGSGSNTGTTTVQLQTNP